MDEVPNIDPTNPDYLTYHIILSSTGETLKIYGCKLNVGDNFCGICQPEPKFGAIPTSLLDPPFIPPDYKRTEPWSFTNLYAPPRRGDTLFVPESAIVVGITSRDEGSGRLVEIYREEKRDINNVRVSRVFWHPAYISYPRWRQEGYHEATYLKYYSSSDTLIQPPPPHRYRINYCSSHEIRNW